MNNKVNKWINFYFGSLLFIKKKINQCLNNYCISNMKYGIIHQLVLSQIDSPEAYWRKMYIFIFFYDDYFEGTENDANTLGHYFGDGVTRSLI